MKPFSAEEIHGVWGTVLLPILKDQSIDWEVLEKALKFTLDAGLNGIYTNGSAGEFYNQTEAEFDKLSELVAQEAENAGVPFQLGCGHFNPCLSLERVKRVKSLSPCALQVILPDWIKTNNKETLKFLEKTASTAAPIGLVIYNPPHAKKKLPPEDYANILMEGLPVVGCKTAGGDKEWYSKMNNLPKPFSYFIPGHFMVTGITQGAKGTYSNIACMHPKAVIKWYRMMGEEPERAQLIEKQLLLFFEREILPLILEEGYCDVAIDKFLAGIGDWSMTGTRLRWPYTGIDPERIINKRRKLNKYVPEFFKGLD